MSERRGGQTYCDWCYGPLTTRSITISERLGLDAEYSWACEACLGADAYRRPPDGWNGDPARWPFAEG